MSYDPETGVLTRATSKGCSLKGTQAGYVFKTKRSKTDYRRIEIDGKKYFEHILIWFYMTGYMPAQHEVDHKDQNGLNNKFDNLRLGDKSDQQGNRSMRKDNTTGYRGVYLNKKGRGKPYYSKIVHNKTYYSLGYFWTAEEAFAAYVG